MALISLLVAAADGADGADAMGVDVAAGVPESYEILPISLSPLDQLDPVGLP